MASEVPVCSARSPPVTSSTSREGRPSTAISWLLRASLWSAREAVREPPQLCLMGSCRHRYVFTNVCLAAEGPDCC